MSRLRNTVLLLVAVAIAALLYGRIIYGAPEKPAEWNSKGTASSSLIFATTPSSISFVMSNGETIMKFAPNGDIFVRGRLAENDIEVVNTMRTFLRQGCPQK